MILKLGKRFLCFFDMSLQKNVKSHVFLDFEEKKRKNVFSNYDMQLYTLRVLAYHAPPALRCVNDEWKEPESSKVCIMAVQWVDIGFGNLQHNSTYVSLKRKIATFCQRCGTMREC